jgi:hypothetical protein
MWSDKFWPTEGRLRTGLIPKEDSADEFPIPERNKMFGAPMVPAERITSFLAVTANRCPEFPSDRPGSQKK